MSDRDEMDFFFVRIALRTIKTNMKKTKEIAKKVIKYFNAIFYFL